MAEFKYKFNTRTGQWNLVPTNIVLAFKAGVATQANLPLTGNAKGDARITNDTGHLYVWSIDASSGELTDWVDAGDIVDLNWDAISGKPSSSPANIDDAVSKRHTQNSDTKLAEGTANEVTAVNAKDTVDKKHVQGTDLTLDVDAVEVVSEIDSYVKALLHFDGIEGSTTFTDELGHVFTSVNGANLDASNKKFGTACGRFNGGSQSRITSPDSDDWYFGTEDFTIDFWMRFNLDLSQSQQLIGQYIDNNNRWMLSLTNLNKISIYFVYEGNYKGTYDTSTTYPFIAYTWYHIAVERIGTTCKIFINGVSQSLNCPWATFGTNDVGNLNALLSLSCRIDGNFSGGNRLLLIDELRISKGIARWLVDFTPPDAAYISDKKIKILDGYLTDNLNNTVAIPDIKDVVDKRARGTFVNGDLVAGILTISHNFGLAAPYMVDVNIFNDSGDKIIPDAITGTANTIIIDFTSYGILSGTYGYLLIA